MEIVLGLVLLAVGYGIWQRIKAAAGNRRMARESPRYAAHIQSCGLCFRDGGPYPFQPCPVGTDILTEEILARPKKTLFGKEG
jgi:hypothetical protein